MPSQLMALRRLSLALQAMGFLGLIAITWLDELLDLPAHLFHAKPTPFRPEEALFESLLLVIVAIASLGLTSRLLRWLIHAQSFLPLCPACQRVRRGERWTSISDFMQEEHGDFLGYGLCPSCSERSSPEARTRDGTGRA